MSPVTEKVPGSGGMAAVPAPVAEVAPPAPTVDLLHQEATLEALGGLRTPLMMAVLGGFTSVVNVFLEFRRKLNSLHTNKGSSARTNIYFRTKLVVLGEEVERLIFQKC